MDRTYIPAYFWVTLVALLQPALSEDGLTKDATQPQSQPQEELSEEQVFARSTLSVVNVFLLEDFNQSYNEFHQKSDFKDHYDKEHTIQAYRDTRRQLANECLNCKSEMFHKSMAMHKEYQRHLHSESKSPKELFTAFYVRFLAMRYSLSFLKCVYDAMPDDRVNRMHSCYDVAWYLINFSEYESPKLYKRMETILTAIVMRDQWLPIQEALDDMEALIYYIKKYLDDSKEKVRNKKERKLIQKGYDFQNPETVNTINRLAKFFTQLLFGRKELHSDDQQTFETKTWEKRMWYEMAENHYMMLCTWEPAKIFDDLSKDAESGKHLKSNVFAMLHFIEDARIQGNPVTALLQDHYFLRIALRSSHFQVVNLDSEWHITRLGVQFQLQSSKDTKKTMKTMLLENEK